MGIGRRKGLKIPCLKRRPSSSPGVGTITDEKKDNKIALGTAQFSNNYGVTNYKHFNLTAIENILEKA